ncbi:MAG: SDR family oxidoreductase [Pseudomonadota bacterium]
MTGRLEKKIALVIGAGAVGPGWGNGRAIAARFIEEGATVIGTDMDADALKETAAMIEARTGKGDAFKSLVADATDNDDLDRAIDACGEPFGRIDVLVNNVGGSAPGDVVAMSDEVWQQQMERNLGYVFRSMKRVVPLMIAQGGGAIVNLASIAALRFFGPDVAAYAASKAGLIHLSKVTAVKYAPDNVRINTVIPGLMNTPLVKERLVDERADGDAQKLIDARHRQSPTGRMGDGFDVANAVLFLASDEAKYITAAELNVDGGLSATCIAPGPIAR